LIFSGLHFLNIKDYGETIIIYALISMICLAICGFKIYKKRELIHKNKKISLLLFLIFSMLHCILFIFDAGWYPHNRLIFIKLGFIIYLFNTFTSSVREIFIGWKESTENKMFKKLAYTDVLTHVGNRFAFEEKIKEYDIRKISIISLDINNLKYYNDNFGHDKGDILIKTAAKVLCKTYGNIYRIGGDEFIAIVESTNDESLRKLNEILQELINDYNNSGKNEVILEIASGYAYFKENDKNINDIIKRADNHMYVDKRNKKAKKKS
jgi:diguanylate cyclase (GGDEF)-like protein